MRSYGEVPQPSLRGNDMVRMTKQEKAWRAEDDARTLANAKIIVNDPARLTTAKSAALRMAEKEREEASAMTSVSKIKPNSGLRDGSEKKRAAKKRSPSKPTPAFNVFQRLTK